MYALLYEINLCIYLHIKRPYHIAINNWDSSFFPFSHMCACISSFISFNFFSILHRKRIVGNSFHLWYNICLLGFSLFDLIWFFSLCSLFFITFFFLSAQIVSLSLGALILLHFSQHSVVYAFHLFATFFTAFSMCCVCLCTSFLTKSQSMV